VDDAPLDAESDSIISYLQDNHDTGTRFQTDFSIRVLSADDSTPHLEFSPSDAFYGNECDPAPPPVPEGGSLEGESGYACESDGDCHLIVVDHDECRLYEMWRADIRGDSFDGGCQAIWEIDRVYGPEGRGDYCTSADAAGLPIAPLLVNADEVYAGEVRHALRFILPNQHIRDDIYVRPGTHSTGAASGPPDAPPYSARLRLKADTDVSALSPGAQAVARALMTYGMFLADGGNLTFTMQSDRDTEHSWDDAQLTPQDLKSLEWSDFEVVELGERISYSGGDCTREQVTR
jgi:serine/threonine-protein kinase